MVTFEKQYGRLLRALRIVRGYENQAPKVAELVRRQGIDMSDRVYYSIERGEREVRAKEDMAIRKVLRPEPGYFEQALEADSGGLRLVEERENSGEEG